MNGEWLDPRPVRQARHECQHPEATDADIGRRWRCPCGKTWRCVEGFLVDNHGRDIPDWEPIPPNPGRRADQGFSWGTVDDPQPRRRWWLRWLEGNDRLPDLCRHQVPAGKCPTCNPMAYPKPATPPGGPSGISPGPDGRR